MQVTIPPQSRTTVTLRLSDGERRLIELAAAADGERTRKWMRDALVGKAKRALRRAA